MRPFSRSATQRSCFEGTSVKACGMAKLLGGSAPFEISPENEFLPH